MHLISESTLDGVIERGFVQGDVPGILWSPAHAGEPAPVVLSGHPGGLHKRAGGLVARARLLAAGYGIHVVAIDAPGHGDRARSAEDEAWVDRMQAARAAGQPLGDIVADFNASIAERAVPEWRSVLDALEQIPGIDLTGGAGYTGMTLATEIGIRLAAADRRIAAAVFGAAFARPGLVEAARRVTVPVQYVLSWDDPEIDRDSGLTLFDAFGSADKVLRAVPGPHSRVPQAEIDESTRRLVAQLGSQGG
jgi:fermentation-respiration switch protein FrsA (DUF1100 family)